jgi:hypothetical protein
MIERIHLEQEEMPMNYKQRIKIVLRIINNEVEIEVILEPI